MDRKRTRRSALDNAQAGLEDARVAAIFAFDQAA